MPGLSLSAAWQNERLPRSEHRPCEAAQGFDVWYRDYAEKAVLLTDALRKYNDGRMKRFLCELFIGRDLDTLQTLMHRAGSIAGTPKDVGKAFRALVETMDAAMTPTVVLRPFVPKNLVLLERW